jgi:hypothetical protein
MTDANYMIHVTKCELQQLVCQYTPRVCEAKETVISENGPESHGPRMQYSLMAEVAETRVAVYDFNPLPYDDVSKDWKEGENGREGRFAVYDKEGHMVDFKAVCKVADTCPTCVCVGYDYYFMSTIDEFLGMLLATM